MAKSGGFKFSASDQRKLERAVKKEASKALRPVARDLEKMLNGMSSEFEGRPVEEIKPVLAQRWAKTTPGGSITDPELTQYAERIAAGGSFTMQT
ncbi:hypothetical protein [Streptomyces sp. NPDC057794]|uniref:hypothetical protein n=1 Tax=Streptomyces sp. NPDC057794 TaxID=3346251 RepID=UPI00367EC1D5